MTVSISYCITTSAFGTLNRHLFSIWFCESGSWVGLREWFFGPCLAYLLQSKVSEETVPVAWLAVSWGTLPFPDGDCHRPGGWPHVCHIAVTRLRGRQRQKEEEQREACMISWGICWQWHIVTSTTFCRPKKVLKLAYIKGMEKTTSPFFASIVFKMWIWKEELKPALQLVIRNDIRLSEHFSTDRFFLSFLTLT